MKHLLHHIILKHFTTESGTQFENIKLSYQLFGLQLGTAPIVLVNHALTGNSNVAGKEGWWSAIIGENKTINTQKYTVLAFNIPGNGFDGFIIDDYKSFIARDIARLFLKGLQQLNITHLFALIGGSLGGGIAWEMVCYRKCKNGIVLHSNTSKMRYDRIFICNLFCIPRIAFIFCVTDNAIST